MSHENERLVIIRHAPYSSNALREGAGRGFGSGRVWPNGQSTVSWAGRTGPAKRAKKRVRQGRKRRYRPSICWRCTTSINC